MISKINHGLELVKIVGQSERLVALFDKVCEKLQREIDEADQAGHLSEYVTYQESLKLPYFEAALKEAGRMHPAVGFPLERYVPDGNAQVCGHSLPAGTNISTSAPLMHMDKGVFGNDARVFRPKRWLEASPQQLSVMDRTFIAFGHGSRTCIGKNITLMEMGKLIPQLFRHFDIEWASEHSEWHTHAACRRAVVVETSSIIVVEVGNSVAVVVVASSVVSVEICVEDAVESVVDSAAVAGSVVPVDSIVVTEASIEDINSADVEIDGSDTAVLVTSVDVVAEIPDNATEVVAPRSATEVDSEIMIVVVPVNSVCSLNAVRSDNGAEELTVEEKVYSEIARVVVVVESDCSVALVVSVDDVEDSP
ncbi:hypothetical protein FAGAP_5354 [Fusarium agapanthi]|uniref:Cytochrome P450 n=1 Tax=Fusarium agapanthi TaxID=1803897 RepID=A0A9P5BAJ6_9HYPO|nr:hypothetical protein FAGAP_5354 [Fusarium agapanthi]